MATKTAVAERPKAPPTLKGRIEAARDEIAAVLPAHMDVEKVIRQVRLAVAQNPDLLKCDPNSVLLAVMAACQLGLEINSPLHHAALVPFKTECTLMIEYRGYQSLIRRGGDIRNVEARCVYAGDLFDYRLGSDPHIDHKPSGETDDAKITHAYALAFPKDGSRPIFDVLTRDDIEAARKVSRMAEGQAWKNWYGEMARKTAVRRLSKYLELSPEMAAAIEMDIRGETGEVSAVTPLIDSPARLNAGVAAKTADALADVKARLGGQPAATPPPVGVESTATATAAPKPGSAEGEEGNGQPW